MKWLWSVSCLGYCQPPASPQAFRTPSSSPHRCLRLTQTEKLLAVSPACHRVLRFESVRLSPFLLLRSVVALHGRWDTSLAWFARADGSNSVNSQQQAGLDTGSGLGGHTRHNRLHLPVRDAKAVPLRHGRITAACPSTPLLL